MLVLLILFGVVLYAIVGTIIGTIAYHDDPDPAGWGVAVGIFWPLALVILVIYGIFFMPFILLRNLHLWLLNMLRARESK